MPENRLIYKIGGPPHVIRDFNNRSEMTIKERPETAAAAMASAVPQAAKDRIIEHIERIGKGGPPTLYKREMAAEAFSLLSDPKRCWTLKSIAALFGVYDQTLYEWIQKHEELQFAIFTGRAIQENNFGSMLLHGFKYSSGVEFILTNLHDWTMKQKTEHTLDLNAAIAAQERARMTQEKNGPIWDTESAQKPAPALVRQSVDVVAEPRQDDAEYIEGRTIA